MCLSPYTEILELVFVILPFEPDIMHVGPGGSLTAPVNEIFDIFSLSFSEDLDGAVRTISYPSFDSQPKGLLLSGGAEKNALDPARDYKMDSDFVPGLLHSAQIIMVCQPFDKRVEPR